MSEGFQRRLPHESARAIMTGDVPRCRDIDTAAAALEALGRGIWAVDATVYVLDGEGRPTGSISSAALLRARHDTLMGTLAAPLPARATEELDQEHVAALASRHRMTDMPVVDHDGRFLGVVPAAVLMRVLRQEHVEDMHRVAGIIHQANYAAHALELSPLRRMRNRLPWLLVGLAGSAVATMVMAAFETTLAANVAVAFFVPTIVYLADAIGTQTEAVAVRGLSLTHAALGAILAREMLAGLLIGTVLAVVATPAIAVAFGDWALALAVGISLIGAGCVATGIGLLLPWLLSRLGFDPAFGSGPVATVIQDVLSLLVYFAVVSVLVPLSQ
ncbi:MAG: magnesium transporter [Sphingomonadales bacterium]